MTKWKWLIAVGIVVVAVAPASAIAGGPGACLITFLEPSSPEGKGGDAFGCVDDLVLGECDALCEDEGDQEGIAVDCEFFEGLTCTDFEAKLGEPWTGACEVSDSPIGPFCVLIWTDIQDLTEETICISGGGTWLGDGSTCGAPVPTLPRAGRAALILTLLIGALIVLNFQGMLRSG